MLLGGRGDVAYPLSYRHVEELMEERGMPVDHATLQRWVGTGAPWTRHTAASKAQGGICIVP
jgi:putative transposase